MSTALQSASRLELHPRVALVGNPNVGKSVIFGSLTKRYVTVSNYPGTTVTVTKGKATLDGRPVEVLDSPGINSLVPMSEDEEVTRNILLHAAPGAILQVADAKNLRRALILSSQLAGSRDIFCTVALDPAVPGRLRATLTQSPPVRKYKNGHGEEVPRNNTSIFCEAADALCRAMQEYRRHTAPTVQISGIGPDDMKKIRALFTGQQNKDANKRHQAWLQTINSDNGNGFSFGPAAISYAEDGKGSWKAEALGDSDDHVKDHEYAYQDAFLTSNWKLFHDALQLHRLTVSHDILPKYGICAA